MFRVSPTKTQCYPWHCSINTAQDHCPTRPNSSWNDVCGIHFDGCIPGTFTLTTAVGPQSSGPCVLGSDCWSLGTCVFLDYTRRPLSNCILHFAFRILHMQQRKQTNCDLSHAATSCHRHNYDDHDHDRNRSSCSH